MKTSQKTKTPRTLNAKYRTIVCYDIEVEVYTDLIQCICAYTCIESLDVISIQDKRHFLELGQFMHYLASLSGDVVLFAHNGYGFDHIFLLEYITNCKDVFADFTDLRLLEIDWGKARLIFRDTRAFIQGKLAKIAEEMLGDKKIDLDLKIDHPIETLIEYCYKDVELVVKIVQYVQTHLLKAHNLLSQPSLYYGQADIAFRIVMRGVDVFTHTLDNTLHDLMSQCYYGGRVYSPIYGKHLKIDICCIDIRSMYPASLCRLYPCGDIFFSRDEIAGRLGIFYLTARRGKPSCVKMTKAIVPIRDKRGMYFVSHGLIKGFYCSPDIAAMRLDGWDVTIEWGIVWNDVTDILRTKYEGLYEERKQYPKSHAKNQSLKIVLNSSYGKFCQIESAHDSRPKFVGWFCLAYSRLQLFHLMALTKDQPVLYGDTDSVFVSSKILPIPDCVNVNHLSVTDDTITADVESFHKEIIVLGKKTYGLVDECKVKAKGIPSCTIDHMIAALSAPVNVPYLAKGNECIKQTSRGTIVASAHNLVDKKRMLRVNIPKESYKCDDCKMFHTCEINMLF